MHSLRQSAVYGLGMIASKSPGVWKLLEQNAIDTLIYAASIILKECPKKEVRAYEHCMDNVMSGLGRVIEFQWNNSMFYILKKWLAIFPVKRDREEAI